MALPILAGEIVLKDSTPAALKNFVSNTAAADQALTKLQEDARRTTSALSGVGSNLPAGKSFVPAIAPAQAEQARQFQQANQEIAASERALTQALVQESQRQQAVDQQATAAHIQQAQQRATADRQAVLQAGAAQSIAFGRQSERGLQVIDLDAIQQARAAEQGLTQAVNAASNARKAAVHAEGAARAQQAQATAAAVGQAEQKITAQHKAEVSKRNADDVAEGKRRQQAAFNPVSALTSAAGVLGIGLGVRELAQQTVALAELGTQANRAASAFNILSGGADIAQARIAAIQTASGGALDGLQAMQIGTQAISLNLAKTTEDFARITQAGRAVALVSPVIHDVGSAISELGLASANLSFRRLDQLGLNVGEVKAKIKELQSANSGLDDSQAFLEASVSLLIQKYGALLNTTQASATGLELLQTRMRDLRIEAGQFAADKLDQTFRTIANAIGGNTGLNNEMVLLKENLAGLRSGGPKEIGLVNNPLLEQQADRLQFVSDVFNELGAAQAAGVKGANDFAVSFGAIVSQINDSGTATDEQIDRIIQLARNYDIGSDSVNRFNTAINQRAQTQGLDEIRQKIQQIELQGLNLPVNPDAQRQLNELRDVLADAEAHAKNGIAITIDPRVKGLVSEEVSKNLPDTAIIDSVTLAEQRLIDTTLALNQARADSITGEAPLTAEREHGLVVAQQRAAADHALAIANQDLTAAQLELAQSQAGLTDTTVATAQAHEDAARQALTAAQARKELINANEEVSAAEQRLRAATAGSDVSNISLAGSELAVAQAHQQRAQAAFDAASGETQAASGADAATEAHEQFANSLDEISNNIARMLGGIGGMPEAFSAAGGSAEANAQKLEAFASAINSIALAALQGGAANARDLLPILGVEGTLAKEREFQGQHATIVNDFIETNKQLVAEGKAPLDVSVLQERIAVTNEWQKATVDAQQDIAGDAEKQATRSAKAWEKAQDRIQKATAQALNSLVEGVIKPSTEGLISGNEFFKDIKDNPAKQTLLNELLPRDDVVDENARRMADVAVKGFKSPWFEGLKDLFPPEVIEQGEHAIQVAAAHMVREHEKGLNTFLFDVPKAADQVLERITAKKNTDALIAQVRERVQGLADISNLDIKEALGIDTTVEQISSGVADGLTKGLGALPEKFDQLFAQLTGKTNPIAQAIAAPLSPEQQAAVNEAMLASVVTAAGTTATGIQKAIATNPLVAAIQPTEDQQAAVVTTAQNTMTAAGEAMVQQSSDGNYGGRAIDSIIAAFEAKRADIEKAGRNAADWLGKSLVDRFRDGVPAQLLHILRDELVPLMAAASASNAERTAGQGVQ